MPFTARMRRSFADTAQATELVYGISAVTDPILVEDGESYPDGSDGPFIITIDRTWDQEERILVDSRTGNSLSGLTRGFQGVATDHAAGAVVEHTSGAVDYDEANEHVSNDIADPHSQYILQSALPALTDASDVRNYGALCDGTTIDTTPINDAVTAAVLAGGTGHVHFPKGTTVTAQISLGNDPIVISGAGMYLSTLRGTTDGGYIIRKITTVAANDIEIRDLTLDCNTGSGRSALFFQYVNNFSIRRCRFVNVTAWGMVIGVLTGADSTVRNNHVLVEDCVFEGLSAGTLEQILLMNSKHVTIRRCQFLGLDNSAKNSLGLFQKLYDVTVEDCYFESTAGTPIYFCQSTDHIRIRNNTFLTNIGMHGANQPDNGSFGETRARNIIIEGNRFTVSGAYGVLIGAVTDALISGNVFYRCNQAALIIDDGLSPVTGLPGKNIKIIGNDFREINQSGTLHPYRCPILVQNGSGTVNLYLHILGNTFEDEAATSTQRYCLSLAGTATYDHIIATNNHFESRSGTTVYLDPGVTLGANVQFSSNSGFVPSTGGPGHMYQSAGALMYRGSTGTITEVGPA